jgi:DNA polymerase
MSQSARSAVFLDEMGVGAQWKLRHVAVQAESELAEEAVGAAASPATPQAAAEPPAATPQAAAQPPIDAPSAPATPQAAAQPPVAASSAPSARVVPAAEPSLPADDATYAPEDDSTAWFDEAPAPARTAPVSDEAIAAMDWPALKTAVSTCTRCSLCDTRRNAVNGRGAGDASWIAIAAAPSRLDEKDKQPVTGEAGLLLDNMLKAISLKSDTDVYVTNLVKCRPSSPDGSDRVPTADELTACRPFFDRELVLTGATMGMTFGQFAAKGLMMGPAARGKVMRYGAAELPVVATYHPDDLLRKPEDKAKAWGDLCLAKAARD